MKKDRKTIEAKILEVLNGMITNEFSAAKKALEENNTKEARQHIERAAALSAALGAVEYTIESFK